MVGQPASDIPSSANKSAWQRTGGLVPSPVTHLTHSISELVDHPITRAADVLRGGLEKSQYSVFGNTKSPTRVWLPEALTPNENSNSMETPDDQIYIPWRRRHSVNGDRNPGNRTSSHPGARRIRLFLS